MERYKLYFYYLTMFLFCRWYACCVSHCRLSCCLW